MSEYQYYEFQAVDCPLTKEQMAELRALSTRATITSTRFVNVYHHGDFRGDPQKLMERYFDAFVYVANWGTNQLMLRLPRRILNPAAALPYEIEDRFTVRQAGDYVVLNLLHTKEEGGTWITDEEAEGWMPSLLPLREDLANGDLRALYLGWLAGIQSEVYDEADDRRLGIELLRRFQAEQLGQGQRAPTAIGGRTVGELLTGRGLCRGAGRRFRLLK